MIPDSYACRVGKGAQRGMLRAKSFIRRAGKGKWILKCDIKHFFDSIDCHILKRILASKIKDRRTLWLCYKFIGYGTGIPIGNLTSQLFANLYLGQLDHYVKDELGVKSYVRYMDDFMMVCESKEEAVHLKCHLQEWLRDSLNLQFNAKTQVFKESQGVNFLGYLVHWDHIKIRHSTVKRIKRKIAIFLRRRARHKGAVCDIIPSLMSWQGLARWGNCKSIKRKIMLLLNKPEVSK